MKKGSEGQPLTLRDLGFHPKGVMDLANGAYVEVRQGESYPASVTHELDGEISVLAAVAKAARARFEPLGTPAHVVEPTPVPTQTPSEPAGSS